MNQEERKKGKEKREKGRERNTRTNRKEEDRKEWSVFGEIFFWEKDVRLCVFLGWWVCGLLVPEPLPYCLLSVVENSCVSFSHCCLT